MASLTTNGVVIATELVDYSNPAAKMWNVDDNDDDSDERGQWKDEGGRGQIGSRKYSEQSRHCYHGDIFFFFSL